MSKQTTYERIMECDENGKMIRNGPQEQIIKIVV